MSSKPGKSTKKTGTRRELAREKRRQQQKKQRLYIVLAILGAAIIIAAIVIVPSLLPVGEIKDITPLDRPLVDGRAMGEPEAPVLVEVFEDFQCPVCRTYSEEIEPRVVEAYVTSGDVYYIFRHYPFLDDQAPRKESDQAANASMCAANQGRFWDYHDMLFTNWEGENQGAFNDRRLVAFAEALELDMQAFNQCFDANTYAAEINSDLQKGQELGVSGTPSVFVNGRILTPGRVPSFEEISAAVEAELAGSGN